VFNDELDCRQFRRCFGFDPQIGLLITIICFSWAECCFSRIKTYLSRLNSFIQVRLLCLYTCVYHLCIWHLPCEMFCLFDKYLCLLYLVSLKYNDLYNNNFNPDCCSDTKKVSSSSHIKVVCFCPWWSWTISHLALTNNQSELTRW
jgi:hypothetical protein